MGLLKVAAVGIGQPKETEMATHIKNRIEGETAIITSVDGDQEIDVRMTVRGSQEFAAYVLDDSRRSGVEMPADGKPLFEFPATEMRAGIHPGHTVEIRVRVEGLAPMMFSLPSKAALDLAMDLAVLLDQRGRSN
ncbi:hypothetical protein N7I30_13990 [Aurantimonas litoralis]|nr:hypothetical protein [Aurantimonas litoralis]